MYSVEGSPLSPPPVHQIHPGRLHFDITAAITISSHPPSCLAVRLALQQSHLAALQWAQRKLPFIWPAVTLLQRAGSASASKPVSYHSRDPSSPLCSPACLSRCSKLTQILSPITTVTHPIPFRSSSHLLFSSIPVWFFAWYVGNCRAQQSSPQALMKEGEKNGMSWAGGFLLHHITGCLPIKKQSLCYWNAV